MKKTIKTIFCTAIFAVLAVSCQKEIGDVEPNTKGTLEISINGLMGEYSQADATKAELVNTVRVSWKGDETVYVYDGTQCLGSLAASLEGDEDRYALLSTDASHTVIEPAAGTKTLTLVYSPLLTEAPAVSGGAISISFASQSGEKAPFVAYATLDYTGTTITDAVVPFQFATSVIKVNCTGLNANAAIDNATLSNVNTACKLTLSGTAAPIVSGDVFGAITRIGDAYFAADKVNSEGVAVFQIAAPVFKTASKARILTIAQGPDHFEYKNFSTKSLPAATSVNTVCQLVELPAGALPGLFSVSATKQIHFSKGNLYAKYEDSKWNWNFYSQQFGYNSLNTGYERSAESGDTEIDTFTWGYDKEKSTDPVGEDYVKSHYNQFDELVYDRPSSEGGDDWGVAYCESNNVAVGTWRTLTTAEWQYLFSYDGTEDDGTDYSNSIRKDRYRLGVTVCGKENCAVFAPDFWDLNAKPLRKSYDSSAWSAAEAEGLVCLPAAGLRSESNIIGVGIGGFYWSSSAAYEDYNSYDVLFDDGRYKPHKYSYRHDAHSVRLVTDSQ